MIFIFIPHSLLVLSNHYQQSKKYFVNIVSDEYMNFCISNDEMLGANCSLIKQKRNSPIIFISYIMSHEIRSNPYTD